MMSRWRPSLPFLLAVLLACCRQQQTVLAFDYQWKTGRATHYGGLQDPWHVHAAAALLPCRIPCHRPAPRTC
jgi:hypothetical protein